MSAHTKSSPTKEMKLLTSIKNKLDKTYTKWTNHPDSLPLACATFVAFQNLELGLKLNTAFPDQSDLLFMLCPMTSTILGGIAAYFVDRACRSSQTNDQIFPPVNRAKLAVRPTAIDGIDNNAKQ